MRDHAVAVKGGQVVEPAPLVRFAQLRGAAQQLFLVDLGFWVPAQLVVECPQQRVLAAGGRCEIGCAVDDAALDDEHAVILSGGPTSPGRAATLHHPHTHK
jgi:hypothetical protein